MDFVDLYLIHRWDAHTPIEETMQARGCWVVVGNPLRAH